MIGMIFLATSLSCLAFAATGLEAAAPAPTGLDKGYGEYIHEDAATGKSVKVYYYKPSGYSPASHVLFAMHGENRTAFAYRLEWKEQAEKYGFMLLVPHFDEEGFPGANGYQLGNVVEADRRTEPDSPPTRLAGNPEATWVFSMMDRIWEDFRKRESNDHDSYAIFGHSAGAQFVHRMLLCYPQSKADFAIAANAGWYLMPDEGTAWPFGTGGAGTVADRGKIDGALTFPLVLLLGDADVLDNFKFNKSPEAMRQGSTRFERGNNFYEYCRKLAADRGIKLGWNRVVVPGVGHSNREMAAYAAEILDRHYKGQ